MEPRSTSMARVRQARLLAPPPGSADGIVRGCCPSTLFKNPALGCVVGFPWKLGRSYTLVVSLTSKNKTSETWTASVAGAQKGKPLVVGIWKVPASWGLLRSTATVPLGSQVAEGALLPNCTEEPYIKVTFDNPVATKIGGSHVTARIIDTYSGACKSGARIHAKPGDSRATIQMGYAWRPGATPSPSPSPPVGVPVFSPLPMPTGTPVHLSDPIRVGAPQLIIPGGKYGLYIFPDEAVSYLHFSKGSYRMWVDSGSSFGDEAFLFDWPSSKVLIPVPAAMPLAIPAYSTMAQGTQRFDADYAGPGTVTPASNGRDLLMIYHAENHNFGGLVYDGIPGPAYFTVGMAWSTDDGEAWSRVGAIITGRVRKPTLPPQGAVGAGNPSAIAVDGYLYCIYTEVSSNGGPQFAIARAKLTSAGSPGGWKKYYKGSFSSDSANHGPFTPLRVSVSAFGT